MLSRRSRGSRETRCSSLAAQDVVHLDELNKKYILNGCIIYLFIIYRYLLFWQEDQPLLEHLKARHPLSPPRENS